MADQAGSTSSPIDARQFHEAAGVDDWRVVGEGACAYFRTGSFAAGARLVVAVSELAGLEDNHRTSTCAKIDPRARGPLGDEHAPSWSTLEDAEGNRVCVCTWLTRDRPQ